MTEGQLNLQEQIEFIEEVSCPIVPDQEPFDSTSELEKELKLITLHIKRKELY
jgi:hypothetical protein